MPMYDYNLGKANEILDKLGYKDRNNDGVRETDTGEWKQLRWVDISMVFQDAMRALNPVLPVGDQVIEVLKHHKGMKHKDALANAITKMTRVHMQMLMEKVRLPFHFAGRFPSKLSRGQKQRVAIARALALEPQLLATDETTSSLDALTERRVIELLKDLHEKTGISVLFITHNLEIVRSLADRVGVMHRGKLIEIGETEKIFKSPQKAYTRELLEAVPIFHPKYRTSRR